MNNLSTTTLAAHFPAVAPEILRALEMKSPLTAATVKGHKGKKRNGVSAWPVTILDTPAQLPPLAARIDGLASQIARIIDGPSAWAWKCSLSSSPSTSPPSPNRWRIWKTIWRCPHDRKKKLTQLGRAFLLIETLAPHVVTGLSVPIFLSPQAFPLRNVCRDMDALASEGMAHGKTSEETRAKALRIKD